MADYLLRIALDPISNHGITLEERFHHPGKHVAELGYSDDIALLANQINNVETLLQSLETAALQVLMALNTTKIECMLLNEEPSQSEIQIVNGALLKLINNFKD